MVHPLVKTMPLLANIRLVCEFLSGRNALAFYFNVLYDCTLQNVFENSCNFRNARVLKIYWNISVFDTYVTFY